LDFALFILPFDCRRNPRTSVGEFRLVEIAHRKTNRDMWPICLELAIADSSDSQEVGRDDDDDDVSHTGTQNAPPELM